MAAVGKIDNSVLTDSIQEIISSIVLDNFTEQGKILPLINNYSSQLGKGMDTLSFLCVDDFDMQKQTFPLTAPGQTADGTADPDGNAIVCQNLAITKEQLKIDCKAVVGFKYDPCDFYQSVLNENSLLLSKSSSSLLRQIEDSLITELQIVDALNVVAPIAAGTLSEGDLICLHAALNKKNIPEQDRVFLINPEEHKAMFGLGCLKNAYSSGDATSPFRNGVIGMVMGSPVIWDNRVPAGTILYFHKDHVRYAQQGQISILETDVPKMGCKEMSMTIKYGQKSIKDGCRGAILTL